MSPEKKQKSKNSRVARRSKSKRKLPQDYENILGPDDAEIGDDLTPEEILKRKRESESPDDETP